MIARIGRLTSFERKSLEEAAAKQLIKQQDCSTIKNDEFTHICYGDDLNVLDSSRQWIFEKELAKHVDVEHARVYANKVVLYVNEARLQALVSTML